MIDHGFGVTLGPITDCDLAQIYKWRNNPHIYKWCRQYEPISWHTHTDWFNSLKSRKDVSMYNIRSKDNLQNMGVCGFTSIDLINRHAEFSLYIGTEYWGSGNGAKALKTLVKHGFNALGLIHIFGETFDGNIAIKTFEEVGFKHDGIRRSFYFRDGEFIDAHLYSILPGELID